MQPGREGWTRNNINWQAIKFGSDPKISEPICLHFSSALDPYLSLCLFVQFMWLAGSVRVRWIRKKYLNEARRGTEQSRFVFVKLQNLNSLSVWDTKEGWIWISSHSTFTLINYTASRLNTTKESLAHVSSEWFELEFLPGTHSTNLCQSNRFAIGALQRGWHLFATLLMMPILPTAGLNRLNFAHQQTSDFCVLFCVFFTVCWAVMIFYPACAVRAEDWELIWSDCSTTLSPALVTVPNAENEGGSYVILFKVFPVQWRWCNEKEKKERRQPLQAGHTFRHRTVVTRQTGRENGRRRSKL